MNAIRQVQCYPRQIETSYKPPVSNASFATVLDRAFLGEPSPIQTVHLTGEQVNLTYQIKRKY